MHQQKCQIPSGMYANEITPIIYQHGAAQASPDYYTQQAGVHGGYVKQQHRSGHQALVVGWAAQE